MNIFVVGYPSHLGGADTELWHTCQLWREWGHGVQFIPTWWPNDEWHAKLSDAGFVTHQTTAQQLDSVPELAGSTVVSFCNGEFLKVAPLLRQMGCRLVWVNCMTWAFDDELAFIRDHGPFDKHIYQSRFQRTQLEPKYLSFGYDPEKHGVDVRGAFCTQEWEFAPSHRSRGAPFRVGRLARNDPDKWSSNTWAIYGRIQYPDVRAWVMGIDQKVYEKIGPAPYWATCLPPNELPVVDFYRKLDCLMPINGGAGENWPRVGLEAMAAGVPVVAQNQWGWREMIVHGETGFLCDNDCELAHWAAVMAYDEALRQRIVRNARERLVEQLANPVAIGSAWDDVFGSLENNGAESVKAAAQPGTASEAAAGATATVDGCSAPLGSKGIGVVPVRK
jgi:hypothetical protein